MNARLKKPAQQLGLSGSFFQGLYYAAFHLTSSPDEEKSSFKPIEILIPRKYFSVIQ